MLTFSFSSFYARQVCSTAYVHPKPSLVLAPYRVRLGHGLVYTEHMVCTGAIAETDLCSFEETDRDPGSNEQDYTLSSKINAVVHYNNRFKGRYQEPRQSSQECAIHI